MGFLVRFEPALCTPLCLTSIMILSVSLEMVHVILTDPRLAPSPGAGSAGQGLEPEPWGTPRAADGLVQTLGTRRIAHLAFLAFVLGNVVGNLCLFVRRSPSIRGVFLAGQAVGQGWSYCYVCESHVPQRCGHCHDCKACVLRRDHHCVLFGQCVGHANYRYYLCCLAHLWLGLLHAITLNADLFLSLHNQGLSLHNLLLLFIPWALFFTGQVGLSTFAVAFVADTCLLCFLLVSAFLVFHLQLLRRGLTTREWSVGSGGYDLGWRENVAQLLGHRWYLTWLCPLLPSTLPGDGITFQLRPLPPQPPGHVY